MKKKRNDTANLSIKKFSIYEKKNLILIKMMEMHLNYIIK